MLLSNEGLGVSPAPGTDCGYPRPRCDEVVVSITDLTGPLATRHSTEVAKEENDLRTVGPKITEALFDPIGIYDHVVGEGGNVKGHWPEL